MYILMKNTTKIMCSCYGKIRLGKTEESYLSGKTHIRTRYVQIIVPKSMVPSSSYSPYKITYMIRYRNNTKICVRSAITPFGEITLLITQMTWILLTQMQKIRSVFCLALNFMIIFGTMAIWRYGIWECYLLPF